jgi:hypothetical protein
MYESEYFEIVAHGGTGSLDFDQLVQSVGYSLTGAERPIPCCPPKKEVMRARLRRMFMWSAIVWCWILLNNAVLIFTLFELLRINLNITNGLLQFVVINCCTAVIIAMQLFIQFVILKKARPSRVMWYLVLINVPMFIAGFGWFSYRILFKDDIPLLITIIVGLVQNLIIYVCCVLFCQCTTTIPADLLL